MSIGAADSDPAELRPDDIQTSYLESSAKITDKEIRKHLKEFEEEAELVRLQQQDNED